MRKTGLLLASVALAMLLGSGVALAATITGTADNENLRGTAFADAISAGAGNDVVWGLGGGDRVTGGDGTDRVYGQRGNDRIFVEGAGRDFVDCGPGVDTARVDRRDRAVNCERLI